MSMTPQLLRTFNLITSFNRRDLRRSVDGGLVCRLSRIISGVTAWSLGFHRVVSLQRSQWREIRPVASNTSYSIEESGLWMAFRQAPHSIKTFGWTPSAGG